MLAVATCARCGSFTCADCVILTGGDDAVCTACFERSAGDLLPWDQVRELGVLKAWWRTTVAVMFSPGQTFSSARAEGSFGGAMLYAAISAFLAWSTTGLFYVLGIVMNGSGAFQAQEVPTGTRIGMVIGTLSMLGFAPIAGLVAVVGISAVDHLILKLAGVDSRYEVTFRGAAFSLAPGLLGLIPICGLYAVPVWVALVRVFAYRGLYRTTFGKAAAGALIVPAMSFLMCCGGFSLLYAFFRSGP
ncbi:MAG: YIP1 family protein [Myxococcaceae bacterium]